mgnify:CR=1 FL=1
MDDVSANTEVNKATGKLPSTARVVVIGGGSVGASVLSVSYTHLTLPTSG